MKLEKAIKLALRNISRNKLRNSFVILAFILAVILGGIIIGPVNGFKSYWVSSIKEAGFNAIAIIPGKAEIGGPGYSPPTKYIKVEDALYIKSKNIKEIVAVSPIIIVGFLIFGQNTSSFIAGGWEDLKIIGELKIYKGRFIEEQDKDSQEINAVLGYNVWKKYLGENINVNQKLEVNVILRQNVLVQTVTVKLNVIGLLEKRPPIPGTNLNPNDAIILHLNQALKLINFTNVNKAIVDNIFLSANDFNNLDFVNEEVIKILEERGYKKDIDFTIVSQKDALNVVDRIFSQFNNFINIIWATVIIISSLSVLIVMVITVRERYREIGTLRALGAKRTDILMLFLFESLILCLIGVFIGSIVSVFTIEILKESFEFIRYVTLNIILQTYSIIIPEIILAAIIFALYPSYRATKIEPAIALRYE
jgi:putative ABC transport system permease protein